MDPEIQKALDAGYTPQEIAAELQRRGVPVPPELAKAAAQAAPPVPTAAQQLGRGAVDALKVAVPVGAAVPAASLAVQGIIGAGKGAGKAFVANRANAAFKKSIEEVPGGVQTLLDRIKQFEDAGRGGLVTLSDLHPRMTAEADFVATNHTPSRVRLSEINTARRETAPSRLLGDAEQLTPGGYSAPGMMSDITAQSAADFAKSENGFQGLRDRNPALSPKATRQLLDFAQSPELSRVWGDAAQAGLLPPKPADAPNSFAVLQDMKERLDDATTEAFRKGRGNLGERLAGARDKLVQLLTDQVPGYREVNQQYAMMKQRETQLQRGVEVWNDHSIQPVDLERELKSLESQPELLKAFRQGVVGGYMRDIQNAQTNRNLANQLLAKSEVTERKLQLIFGTEANFSKAIERFRQEAAFSRLGEVVGGSQTARRGSKAAEMTEGALDAAHVVMHPTTGIPTVAGGMARRFLPGQIAERMSPAFTEQGGDALRRILQMLPK